MIAKTVGIIGSSDEDPELNDIAEEMGRLIALAGYSVVNGGREGVMEAASRGAAGVNPRPESSRIIGILPGLKKSEGNQYLDYAISTGIGWARNQCVILSSDIVVAVGGGAGTLSEIAYAWAYNKPVLAFEGVQGWSAELAGKKIDTKRTDKIISVSTPKEAIEIINEIFENM
ncbi:MAG: TIGR00725 family protein [Oligoflexia bacterium]|nr:TIGR00725 family protein [Oligoflexia bacterium]